LIPGMTVTTSTGGITIPNNTTIVSITNNAAVLSNNVTGNGQATITAIGPSDGAAEDGGMIVKGTTDKSILWKGTDSGVTYNTWVSSENFDLAANKKLTLNSICVLDPVGQVIGPVNGTGTDDINLSGGGTPYALGSAVTGSSLTSVGTLGSLNVSGGTTIGDTTYGSNLGQLRIINDASSAPASLALFGYNNTADGDVFAQIQFAEQESGTGGQVKAKIEAQAVSTNERGASLAFFTSPNASSSTPVKRLDIDEHGNMTNPYQYHAVAQRSGNISGYDANGNFGTALVFNNLAIEQRDSNLPTCFDGSTGLFTVPVDGVYFCEGSAYTSAGNIFTQAWFTVNGSRKEYTDWVLGDPSSIVNSNSMIKLSAGDTVGFHPHAGGGNASIQIIATTNHTWFKITLMN